ncbi:MAG TPA: LEA type 2 family protein [Longimicrobiaceae bacterium]|nr:LEA type 2 family protein [Longimicrobiaceae bacterium]
MRRAIPVLLVLVLASCASLGSLAQAIQAPRFDVASGFQPQLRLLGPSTAHPLGGASIRLWAHVDNPNPVGIVLSALSGSLALEGTRAADVSFPLGLPLPAADDTVIPLDIAVSFADLPGLANVVQRAFTQGTVDYQLRGTVAVDAGLLGTPTFGPMSLLSGSIRTR